MIVEWLERFLSEGVSNICKRKSMYTLKRDGDEKNYTMRHCSSSILRDLDAPKQKYEAQHEYFFENILLSNRIAK